MESWVILFALLAIIAAAIFIVRNRRLRPRSKQRSRFFSVDLTNPDATGIPDDRPR